MHSLIHRFYDAAAGVVLISSLIYSIFPPVEEFEDYPRFQKAYAFIMIFVLRFASLNLRSAINPSIRSTANQGGTKLPEAPGAD